MNELTEWMNEAIKFFESNTLMTNSLYSVRMYASHYSSADIAWTDKMKQKLRRKTIINLNAGHLI